MSYDEDWEEQFRVSPDYDDWEDEYRESYEYDEEDRWRIEEGSEESEHDYKGESESPTYAIDPSDYSRITFGKRTDEIAKTAKEKQLRDPRNTSLQQMRGAMSNFPYEDIHQNFKSEAYDLVEELPEAKMILYNIDILTAAVLYTVMYRYKGGVSKKNIAEFFKDTSGLTNINHLDFIRYIRDLAQSVVE
jgi:hypothetical protein